MQWKKLETKEVLANRFFQIDCSICEKADGSLVDEYYRIHRSDVVMVAALTAKQELVLISQYRFPVDSVDIELPAGYIDKNESPETAARRELLEETGYQSPNLTKICESFASAGLMSNKIHFFVGTDAHKVAEPTLDEHEEIQLKITPWTEALEMLKKHEIKDLASITGILLLKQYLKEHA